MSRDTFERGKRPDELLVLRKLLFTVEVQHLENWSVTDSEQIRLNVCFMLNAGPRRSHEDIPRTPLEEHSIDHRATAALKDDVDRTARLAFRRCACTRGKAVHLAGKGTHCRTSSQRVHELQAHK